jgi:K+-sensing histidine kinase KdpD
MRAPREAVVAYSVAVAAVTIALTLKYLFVGLGADHPFVLLGTPVLLAAWYGGRGPGLAATVLVTIGADWLFLAPFGFGLERSDILGLLGLLAEGVLIVAVTVGLRTAQKRARYEADEAIGLLNGLVDDLEGVQRTAEQWVHLRQTRRTRGHAD